MRAVGYIRVSTDEQAANGTSIESQGRRITEWCERHDVTLAVVYIDPGLSGKRADNRPGLQGALEWLREHKERRKRNTALVVYSLSRLARSVKDAINIVEQIEKANADFVSLTESLNTSTAMGKLFFHITAMLAELERNLISERTRCAMHTKRIRNERISGRLPYGYDLGPDGMTLVENTCEQIMLTLMQDMRNQGRSYATIATWLTDECVPTKTGKSTAWTHQAVRGILMRAAQKETDK